MKGQLNHPATNGLKKMLLGAAAVVVSAILLPATSSWAGNSNPVITVSGSYTGGMAITNSVSVFIPTGILTVQYTVAAGNVTAQSAQTIAGDIVNALNAGDNPAGVAEGSNMPTYFTFAPAAASPRTNMAANPNGAWVIQGTNNTPVKSFGSSRTTGKGMRGVRVGVSIDPFSGDADFQISGTPAGDGTVTLGIDDGDTVTMTPTIDESDDNIMQTLESELSSDYGLTDDSLNMSDADLTVDGIDTGNPDGTGGVDTDGLDIGAFLDTTDSGLSTYADVVVPEPASLSLLAIAGLGLLRRQRRPAGN